MKVWRTQIVRLATSRAATRAGWIIVVLLLGTLLVIGAMVVPRLTAVGVLIIVAAYVSEYVIEAIKWLILKIRTWI